MRRNGEGSSETEMKKLIVMLAIAMAGGGALAATVFTDDFSSFAPFDPADNPVIIYDDNAGGGTTEQWLTGGVADAPFSQLRLKTAGDGKARGIAYVLDPTQTPGLVAGDYTISINVVNQYNLSTFEFFAYEGVRNDTGTANTYALDLLSNVDTGGNQGALTHTTVGAGSLTLLDSATWTAGAGNSGTVTLSFAYDGTNDLVIVMNQRTTATFEKITTLDDLVVDVKVPSEVRLMILNKNP